MKKIYVLLLIFLISITGFSQNEIGTDFYIVDPGYQVVDIEFDLEIENATYNGTLLDASLDDYRVTVEDQTNNEVLKVLSGAPFDNGELTIEDIIIEHTGTIDVIVRIEARFANFNISKNIDILVLHNKWTGQKDSDWHDSDNWVHASIPSASDEIIIPSGYDNAPVVSNDNAGIYFLCIDDGTVLTVKDGKNLTVIGSLENHGIVTIREDGILRNEGVFTITADGGSVIGSAGKLINSGTMTIEGGGFLTIRSTAILTNIGVLTVDSGGELENNGTIIIDRDGELINHGDLEICDYGLLTISPEGGDLVNNGTLTIFPRGKLNSEGTVTNNSGAGGLILESATYGSASFIHNNSGVEATVRRYIAGAQTFHIVSTSVSGQSIQQFLSYNHGVIAYNASHNIYAMQHYDEENGKWSDFYPPNQAGNVEPGVAYGVGLGSLGTIAFEGTLVHDDLSVDITRDGSGWNGIGNPFACALNVNDGANSFLSKYGDQLDPEYYGLYVWDPVAGHYKIINSVPGLSQNYLASAQGFLVRAKDGGGTVVFETGMREHENPQFRKEQQEHDNWHKIVLQAENNEGQSPATALAFNKNMTTDFDVGYDAGLFTNDPSFKFYSRLAGETAGPDLVLQALPELWNVDAEIPATIPLGITYAKGGQVTFSAKSMSLPDNVMPMLEDTETGTLTNLSEEKYTAHIPANADPLGRFYLHMQHGKQKPEPAAYSENIMQTKEPAATGLSVFPNPARDKFNVRSNDVIDQIRLINISGQVIMDVAVNASKTEINVSGQRPGIYLMQIRTGEKIVTRRVRIAH